MSDWIDLAGPQDAPPVVFLHGGGANRGMWRWQLEALASEFRVIVPDLPGHGHHPDRTWRFKSSVDSVAEVIDRHAGGRALVVGLSLGGYVGMGVAQAHPGKVRGLILSGATAQYLGWGGLETRLFGGVVRVVGPVFRRLNEKAMSKLAERGNAPAAQAIPEIGMSMRGAAQVLMRLPGRDFHAITAAYPGPVMILNGERDKV
ncbi:MAG: alpha/beta hydrolase, partial [Acidimicrobiia bacterium]|nr:alpha/beta hydrolase [Acidimicrobiia bacterium]